MKHIKSYKIFESAKLPKGVDAETIRDICYDITDDGKFSVGTYTSSVSGHYIFIEVSLHLDYEGFEIGEISECILRLRRYLGEHFNRCGVIFVGSDERVLIDLDKIDNNPNYYGEIRIDSKISNLVIYID